MRMKRIASLTAFLSLFFVLLTSAVLYIVPQGRVAYWANWKLWGLLKEQWAAIHINVGILFLIALLLHTYYNWESITFYLKDKSRRLKIFTKDFNIALLLIVVCVVGTYAGIPPFSTIIELNSQVKEAAAEKYGTPPYGHAELSSIKSFARHLDINLNVAIKSLHDAGYSVAHDMQSLKEVASANGVSPQQIYLAMAKAFEKSGETKSLPRKPGQGMGRLTLKELCRKYDVDSKLIMKALKEANITFQEEMTIKQIGALNGLSPIDVYRKIHEIIENEDMI